MCIYYGDPGEGRGQRLAAGGQPALGKNSSQRTGTGPRTVHGNRWVLDNIVLIKILPPVAGGLFYPSPTYSTVYHDEVLMYNSEEDKWTTVGHLSTARIYHAMSLVPGNTADHCLWEVPNIWPKILGYFIKLVWINFDCTTTYHIYLIFTINLQLFSSIYLTKSLMKFKFKKLTPEHWVKCLNYIPIPSCSQAN